ncbi:hypothetical protein AB0N81_02960 [Streptomyces sp. NPDC093510]|uniref:hypothetical protein n=1 Tax=Streptomyces sp. NPDC093510 TaxID=3155199 RepID=UPI003414ED07
MSEQPLTGLNWVLFVVGSFISIAASVASLVWGLPWLVAVSAACFAAQLIGWRRHGRQSGGGE